MYVVYASWMQYRETIRNGFAVYGTGRCLDIYGAESPLYEEQSQYTQYTSAIKSFQTDYNDIEFDITSFKMSSDDASMEYCGKRAIGAKG